MIYNIYVMKRIKLKLRNVINQCFWSKFVKMVQLCVNSKTWFHIDHKDKILFSNSIFEYITKRKWIKSILKKKKKSCFIRPVWFLHGSPEINIGFLYWQISALDVRPPWSPTLEFLVGLHAFSNFTWNPLCMFMLKPLKSKKLLYIHNFFFFFVRILNEMGTLEV